MVARTEQEACAEIETRLAAKFATLSAADVTAAVEGARAQFAGSKIRDFVPLLVERRADEELTRREATAAASV
ncbi:hypothetical protein FZI85_21535 [Mycobacterium sp. CBMA293]|uniref:three-helix bundle dimerization domain-containing protein n=1 Tax=unclassified Mycolicibacterium TaxID=2636767 RepID=UPI0012DF38C2|nr:MULTISPECIES: hypothetical protein [unclassified Mycolicibacterium]MUL47271.1 hypothetical protein [Mycolicibacterium sp. CBMA 360]MUL61382.1 hypothetical protein [Mycolicibacterium sp. CBMA 335]MUL72117.1 hypothetical protein [Mycolicibacterium sp. CBMA 311]MUL96284.1 hypothetical protein [Mycolicibacterium sp. CBMA 230]MUM08893.1 hypothetical protein [Mycolicibacterium sp. CBMA 213]